MQAYLAPIADTVLAQMRNTAAVACEMAMVAIDHNNWARAQRASDGTAAWSAR